MNTDAQFGLATLWRRAKHKFTAQVVKDILVSDRFQNRLEPWTITHALRSNTKAWFEQTKRLSSSSGGLTLCYALRRLGNNIQEPYLTLSLQAIDASIRWWHGKLAPRASALKAPWSLSPDLHKSLKQFLRKWHLQLLAHQVPCHTPSFKTVFIKHASVLDQLCNHKQAITQWSTDPNAQFCCKTWSQYKKAAINPEDPHWVLSGSLLTGLLSQDPTVIAQGSLLNKVFPSKQDYHSTLLLGLRTWTSEMGHPCTSISFPNLHRHFGNNILNRSPVTSPNRPSLAFNILSTALSSIVRTNRPRPFEYIVHVSAFKPSRQPSWTPLSLRRSIKTHK